VNNSIVSSKSRAQLQRDLESANEKVRLGVVSKLSIIREPWSVELLRKAMQDQSSMVRFRAEEAITEIEESRRKRQKMIDMARSIVSRSFLARERRKCKSIVVCEDEEEILSTIVDYFKGFDVEVRATRTGGGVVKEFENAPADILFLDIALPDMDGFSVLDDVTSRGFNIPVIVVSAYADFDTISRALDRGAFDFIEKPFQLEELSDAVRRLYELAPMQA
jgi:CheY-like chemotaxis protein